jgi:hypothetical protein
MGPLFPSTSFGTGTILEWPRPKDPHGIEKCNSFQNAVPNYRQHVMIEGRGKQESIRF